MVSLLDIVRGNKSAFALGLVLPMMRSGSSEHSVQCPVNYEVPRVAGGSRHGSWPCMRAYDTPSAFWAHLSWLWVVSPNTCTQLFLPEHWDLQISKGLGTVLPSLSFGLRALVVVPSPLCTVAQTHRIIIQNNDLYCILI